MYLVHEIHLLLPMTYLDLPGNGGGANPRGAASLLFGMIFAENCMKMKVIGQKRWGLYPYLPGRSANAIDTQNFPRAVITMLLNVPKEQIWSQKLLQINLKTEM